jgi:hypothetical protein
MFYLVVIPTGTLGSPTIREGRTAQRCAVDIGMDNGMMRLVTRLSCPSVSPEAGGGGVRLDDTSGIKYDNISSPVIFYFLSTHFHKYIHVTFYSNLLQHLIYHAFCTNVQYHPISSAHLICYAERLWQILCGHNYTLTVHHLSFCPKLDL